MFEARNSGPMCAGLAGIRLMDVRVVLYTNSRNGVR